MTKTITPDNQRYQSLIRYFQEKSSEPRLKPEPPPPVAADFHAVRAALEKLMEQARREMEERGDAGGLAPQVPVTLTLPTTGDSEERAIARVEEAPEAPTPSPITPAASAAPLQPESDDDETMETVILSPGPVRPRGAPFLPHSDLCETCLPGSLPVASPQAPKSADEEIMETMVAPGSRLHPASSSPEQALEEVPKPAPAAPELLETIFVRPTGGRRPGQSR